MELVRNLSFIEAAASQLISPKPCWYNTHELWTQLSKYSHLKCEVLEITSRHNPKEQFNVYHVHNKDKDQLPCLIYLHGLSSYCFQGQYLFPYAGDCFNLCLYDLRGHGKNKNTKVTFGLKESADLYDLITTLVSKGVKEIYLWGRSMGASTILNFVYKYGALEQIKQLIKFIVLDSPFCSFEQIGKETIGRNLGMPAFICSPLINVTIDTILEKEKIDLRALDFCALQAVKIPAAFIYSQLDDIVASNHSEKIIKGYGGKIFELKGDFSHNQPRPNHITKEAINLLESCKRQKNRHATEMYKSSLPKKGLSISLISCKNIKDDQKQNRSPIKLDPQPKPQKHSLSPKPTISLHPSTPNQKLSTKQLNYQKYLVSYTIRKEVQKNREKIQISQTLIEDRSKSKPKAKNKHAMLTNRRYL